MGAMDGTGAGVEPDPGPGVKFPAVGSLPDAWIAIAVGEEQRCLLAWPDGSGRMKAGWPVTRFKPSLVCAVNRSQGFPAGRTHCATQPTGAFGGQVAPASRWRERPMRQSEAAV